MPSAGPVQPCANPFHEQDGIQIPEHIHQLAQIQLADGSQAEAFYDSEAKRVLFEYRDIYYDCPQTLSVLETLGAILPIRDDIRLSQDSWVDKGQLDYDEGLLASWRSLRKHHRALQLVLVE